MPFTCYYTLKATGHTVDQVVTNSLFVRVPFVMSKICQLFNALRISRIDFVFQYADQVFSGIEITTVRWHLDQINFRFVYQAEMSWPMWYLALSCISRTRASSLRVRATGNNFDVKTDLICLIVQSIYRSGKMIRKYVFGPIVQCEHGNRDRAHVSDMKRQLMK